MLSLTLIAYTCISQPVNWLGASYLLSGEILPYFPEATLRLVRKEIATKCIQSGGKYASNRFMHQ